MTLTECKPEDRTRILGIVRKWSGDVRRAWEHEGKPVCRECLSPMDPCPKGPGADEPGYCGLYPCGCGSGDNWY